MSSSPSERRRLSAVDWSEPPRDVLVSIFQKLGLKEKLGKAHNVCRTWRNVISSEPLLWRSITTWEFDGGKRRQSMMTKKAVDYSSGQLIHFRIGGRHYGELLSYMADRSSGLRRLDVSCSLYDSSSLVNAVKKLPLLEELQVGHLWISEETIETIGTHCPRLTSFIFANTRPSWPFKKYFNKEVLVFGRSMPGLQHLQIYGDMLTDSGLQAILNGCPRIRSLNLLISGDRHYGWNMPERYSSRMEMVHFIQFSYRI